MLLKYKKAVIYVIYVSIQQFMYQLYSIIFNNYI